MHEKLTLKTQLHCSPSIYSRVKNIFSWFFLAILGPKIEKLAFHFVFMRGFKKNEMLTSLFWVPKMPPKKTLKIFLKHKLEILGLCFF